MQQAIVIFNKRIKKKKTCNLRAAAITREVKSHEAKKEANNSVRAREGGGGKKETNSR